MMAASGRLMPKKRRRRRASVSTRAKARPISAPPCGYREPSRRNGPTTRRDLYAEFGGFDLSGLSLAAIDGEYALFDHIYLARTLDDLQKIEVRPAGK